MNLRLAVGLMLLSFVVESTIFPWLVPDALYGRLSPHFVYVFVMFAALYMSRHAALVLGVCFGLLQDIVFYGHMLGVHALSMGLLGYLAGLLFQRARLTLMSALTVVGLFCLAYDSLAYFIYRAFRVTSVTYEFALIEWMLPSLFLQLGFALIVYIPARRLFEAAAKPEAEDEE